MVLVAVEAIPAGSKPPAAVNVRISTGERQDFGAATPLSTTVSSLQRRAGGSVESSPKLVRHIDGPASTLFAEQLYPCFVGSAAASSVRLRVLVSVGTSAFVIRRGFRASYSRPAKRCLVALTFSMSSSSFLSDLSKSSSIIQFRSATVGDQAQLHHEERGHCPWGQTCSASVTSQVKPRRRGSLVH